jgi:hypothetical protein
MLAAQEVKDVLLEILHAQIADANPARAAGCERDVTLRNPSPVSQQPHRVHGNRR